MSTAVPDASAVLVDDTLAAVAHLTGPGAQPLLCAAVRELGASPRPLRVEQVSHEPGRSCTVQYGVELDWGDRRTRETFVATTSVDGPPDGAAVMEADGLRVGLWRYPYDPALPGLADAVLPDRLGPLLAEHVDRIDGVDVLTYRPGRRAVVRVRSGDDERYLKVLRPHRAEPLAQHHRNLCDAGVRVPRLLGADPARGILVLDGLGGPGCPTLRDRLLGGVAADADELHAVAGALAEELSTMWTSGVGDEPARRSPLGDVTAHLAVLRHVLPDESARLDEFRDRLAPEDAGPPDATGAGATVHGDLHDGQLVVLGDGGGVGLLDLDDVGVGARADDLGNLLGHALTLATLRGSGLDAAGAAASRWSAVAEGLSDRLRLDPAQVARRAAAAVASLATGPFRVREPDWVEQTRRRIGAAEDLLDRAERPGPRHGSVVDAGAVRRVSEARHGDLIPGGEN